MLNKINVVTLLITLLTVLIPTQLKAEKLPQIAITQLVQHEAADSVREGIINSLGKSGFVDGKTANIFYENAQGNPTTAAQIARKFAGMQLDVILPITTPSAQTVLKAQKGKSTPIVFSAVTDPVSAGLVPNLDQPHDVVTGVLDMPPIAEQIAFIQEILPQAKTIGILYNPGDEGSAISVSTIKSAASKAGFKVVESPATRSVDVKDAVLSLVGKVDAIYVPLDNTFVSAMRTVAQLAVQNNIPLFSADNGSVVDGALACLGFSYYDQGMIAGDLAVKILNGTPPSKLPIVQPQVKMLYINQAVADQLSLEIPDHIASKAKFL